MLETYVISLDEAMWGGLLVAITMAIHGTGMFGIGIAGLLTVAWSTGILYMLAQNFQDTQLQKRRRKQQQQGETKQVGATHR